MGEAKELWMWGRHVMMGYIGREDATKRYMTEDGWMKSGDLFSIDGDGFHYIVGRQKDLIITAGGENVAPQPIHENVKNELPGLVSQVRPATLNSYWIVRCFGGTCSVGLNKLGENTFEIVSL